MRQVLRELCELLGEQKSLLEGMLRLSQEERRVIISGEAEQLEGVVRQELRELSKLGAIEKKPMALHNAIAAELGLSAQDINVSAIAGHSSPDEQAAIKKLQAELTDLITQHTALNKENRELINAHIEYSDMMLNLMVDSEDPLNNFYGCDGKASAEKKKATGFFDSRA